ncbi:MAG: hypothetical protein K8S14_03510 [Actinomycetia bacterium]|nr:hypothetical protein [Actinomycetes bacterium]
MYGMQYRIKESMAQHKNKASGKISIFIMAVLLILPSGALFGGCGMVDNGRVFLTERFSSDKEMDAAVETVDIFFDLLMGKNYSEAYKYLSSEDKSKGSEQDFIMEFSDITDIVTVEINWVEVKNNTALVGIDILDSYDGGEKMYKDIEVSLIKEEDESWRIVFWNWAEELK